MPISIQKMKRIKCLHHVRFSDHLGCGFLDLRKHGTDFGNHGVFWIQYVFNVLNYKNIVVYLLIQVDSGSENHEYTLAIRESHDKRSEYEILGHCDPCLGIQRKSLVSAENVEMPRPRFCRSELDNTWPGPENAGRSFMWTCLLTRGRTLVSSHKIREECERTFELPWLVICYIAMVLIHWWPIYRWFSHSYLHLWLGFSMANR